MPIPHIQNGLILDSLDVGLEHTMKVTNTCAFDTLLQLLAVAHCDSELYRIWIEVRAYLPALALVRKMMNTGIDDSFYQDRATFLAKKFECVNQRSPDGTIVTVVNCTSSVTKALMICLMECPSVIDVYTCESPRCPVRKEPEVAVRTGKPKGGYKYLQDEVTCQLRSAPDSRCDRRVEDASPSDEGVYRDDWDPTVLRCSGICQLEREISYGHLFIEPMEPSKTFIVESRFKLNELPDTLKHNDSQFYLRGVLAFSGGTRVGSVGHFVAYCRRSSGKWQSHDGLGDKPTVVAGSTLVRCHVVLYTI